MSSTVPWRLDPSAAQLSKTSTNSCGPGKQPAKLFYPAPHVSREEGREGGLSGPTPATAKGKAADPRCASRFAGDGRKAGGGSKKATLLELGRVPVYLALKGKAADEGSSKTQ